MTCARGTAPYSAMIKDAFVLLSEKRDTSHSKNPSNSQRKHTVHVCIWIRHAPCALLVMCAVFGVVLTRKVTAADCFVLGHGYVTCSGGKRAVLAHFVLKQT